MGEDLGEDFVNMAVELAVDDVLALAAGFDESGVFECSELV